MVKGGGTRPQEGDRCLPEGYFGRNDSKCQREGNKRQTFPRRFVNDVEESALRPLREGQRETGMFCLHCSCGW